MRILFIFLVFISLTGCSVESVRRTQQNSIVEKSEVSDIRQIDFKNFSYSRPRSSKGIIEKIVLKDGVFSEQDEEIFSLQSVLYENINGGYGDIDALITIKIDDGNATYHLLYIYELENKKVKLLQIFDFSKEDRGFKTAYFAHSELIIESYQQAHTDTECCPSIVERRHYDWRENKFILVSTQKIPNDYVEKREKTME